MNLAPRDAPEVSVPDAKMSALDLDAEFARRALGKRVEYMDTMLLKNAAHWWPDYEHCKMPELLPDLRDNRNLGLVWEGVPDHAVVEISPAMHFGRRVVTLRENAKDAEIYAVEDGATVAEALRNAVLKWLGVEW
jgi:hypothetical protein